MNALTSGAWGDVAIVLLWGTTLIVLLATIVCRLVPSAAWQRIVWQLATLSVALLLLVETAGFGRAAIALFSNPADAPSPGTPGEGWGEGLSSGSLIAHPQLLPVMTEPESIAETVSATATEPTSPVAEVAIAAPVAALSESPPLAETSQPDASAATAWPTILWLAGSSLVLLRLAAGHALLARFAHRRPRIHDPLLLARIRQISSRLGMRRTVRVLQVSKRSGPMAFGAWRPTIGLPPGFAHEFTTAEQDAMLAHELAHLAGRDTLWHLLADVAAAALWWHPLAWWNRSQLRAASEAVADEASLVIDRGPEVLAGCLVAL
ncbi:MAG: M56 family metallopeptidase, partial [Pirellulales bacterium]